MWTSDVYWCPSCQRDFEAIGLTSQLAICRCGDVAQKLLTGTVATFRHVHADVLLIRAQMRSQARLSVPPS